MNKFSRVLVMMMVMVISMTATGCDKTKRDLLLVKIDLTHEVLVIVVQELIYEGALNDGQVKKLEALDAAYKAAYKIAEGNTEDDVSMKEILRVAEEAVSVILEMAVDEKYGRQIRHVKAGIRMLRAVLKVTVNAEK